MLRVSGFFLCKEFLCAALEEEWDAELRLSCNLFPLWTGKPGCPLDVRIVLKA